MLNIKNLQIDFPGFSLNNINFHVKERDSFSILGPTGSGKTLILETIMGLNQLHSGEIILNGENITSYAPEDRNLGLVYQSHSLFPHLTIRDNILYGTSYTSLSKQRINDKLHELTEKLAITHLLQRYPQNLSGGEKQRASLARVLILDKKVILLDEPFSALDPSSKEDARELLKDLHTNFDITLVIVSHDFADIIYLANNGILLNNGKIIQKGSINNIFQNPNSLFTAKFIGLKNIFPAQITENKIVINNEFKLSIPSCFDNKKNYTHISIRSELIEIISQKNNRQNTFDAIVTKIIPDIFSATLHLKIKEHTIILTTTRKDIFSRLIKIGKQIKLSIPDSAINLF